MTWSKSDDLDASYLSRLHWIYFSYRLVRGPSRSANPAPRESEITPPESRQLSDVAVRLSLPRSLFVLSYFNLNIVNLNVSQVLADTRRVSCIRVVVHAGAAIDGSHNHWSIYLLLQPGGSVRVNMVRVWRDREGVLSGQISPISSQVPRYSTGISPSLWLLRFAMSPIQFTEILVTDISSLVGNLAVVSGCKYEII